MLNECSALLASLDNLIAPADAARSIDSMTQISLKWRSFAVHPTLTSGEKASKWSGRVQSGTVVHASSAECNLIARLSEAVIQLWV